MNADQARIEKEDALFLEVGRMFARNQRQEVDPEKTERKLDAHVRALAEGRPAEDLNVEEVWILGERDGCSDDRMPLDVSAAMGFKPGATYGALVVESLAEAYAQDGEGARNAIQIARMEDIVKVVSPEEGLAGMVGKVRDISEGGFLGVEFPGWGEGHSLDGHLDEPDGWYLAHDELEVLSEE